MANSIQKIADIFTKTINPLRGLTTAQIEMMLNMARQGNDIKLQQSFALIEQTMPIFSVCIEKRSSGLVNRKWDIVPTDDSDESRNQADIVKEIIQKSDELSEDSFTEALRHLSLACFRGRSIVKPFMTDEGLVWKKVENWHCIRRNGKFYWNPTAEEKPVNYPLEEVPKNEICYALSERPIDIPGLVIYLRTLVGENQWAKFVERTGLPRVVLTCAEGTSEQLIDQWTERAQQIFQGGSGAVPAGTSVNQLTTSESQDIFETFLDHQQNIIAIMSVGGNLSTLGGSTGLGSNLATMQEKQFQNLITSDCKKVQNTINNVAIAKICEYLNVEKKCKFVFVEDEEISANEHIDMAIKLKSLGATIDIQKLKEITSLPYISEIEDEAWTPDEAEKDE